MDAIKLRVAALVYASEDWYGFYELVWELNSAYPEVPRSEKVELAKEVLLGLLAEGFIEVSFVPYWPSSENLQVERAAAAVLLREDTSWLDPADSPKGSYYAFSATPAGRSSLLEASRAN